MSIDKSKELIINNYICGNAGLIPSILTPLNNKRHKYFEKEKDNDIRSEIESQFRRRCKTEIATALHTPLADEVTYEDLLIYLEDQIDGILDSNGITLYYL